MHRDELESILGRVIDVQLLKFVLLQLKICSAVVWEDPWVV